MTAENRPKVGLALGSGGTRGLTMVGVFQVLQKHNIEIDYIAGSSTGAVFGGAYAIEKNLDRVQEIARAIQHKDFYRSVSDIGKKEGFVKGAKFLQLIQSYTGDIRIEDLQIPFVAVTTDKDSGETVILDNGDLAIAMRASSSVPVFFDPVAGENSELVDGGLSQAVPVDAVRQMGADVVIAVNLYENTAPYNAKSRLSTAQHYIMLLLKNLARKDCLAADVTISPEFESIDWAKDLTNREKLIAEGARATEEKIDEILTLLSTKPR